MWSREKPAELFAEYFFRRMVEIDENIDEVLCAMRTRRGVLVLCDKMRVLDAEKQMLIKIYNDLKPLVF